MFKILKNVFVLLLVLVCFSTANAKNLATQIKNVNIEELIEPFQEMAIKRIVPSDAGRNKSHMNELHGIKHLISLLGQDKKRYYNTEFLYITDSETQSYKRKVTWYLTGEGKSWEKHRFYYGSNNPIMKKSQAGDLLLIGKVDEQNLKVLIFHKNSSSEKQALSFLKTKPSTEYNKTSTKVLKSKKTKKLIVIGKVSKVYDGDTFVLDNLFKVRMLGIDTPEKKQICQNKKGKDYKCGIKAKEHLIKLIGKRKIVCEMHGWGAYNRHLFICKNSRGVNINKQMIIDGFAVMSSYKPFRYTAEEQQAKNNKLGLWEGNFQNPKDFRKSKRKK